MDLFTYNGHHSEDPNTITTHKGVSLYIYLMHHLTTCNTYVHTAQMAFFNTYVHVHTAQLTIFPYKSSPAVVYLLRVLHDIS